MKNGFQAENDAVVIVPDVKTNAVGLPPTQREQSNTGVIVSISSGCETFNPGDRVLYDPAGLIPFEFDGINYVIVRVKMILLLFNEKK